MRGTAIGLEDLKIWLPILVEDYLAQRSIDATEGEAGEVRIHGSVVVNAGGFSIDSTDFTACLHNLPAADPEVEGQLWNDGGTIKISAGA
jgi:hypothetical protein